jgi:hypothetical protein
MLFDIPDQPIKTLPPMIARAFVVNVAECPFDRICLRAIARQPQHLKSWMLCEPADDGSGLMDFVVVRHDEDALNLRAAKFGESHEQLSEQEIVFTFPDDIVNLPSPIVERTGQRLGLASYPSTRRVAGTICNSS